MDCVSASFANKFAIACSKALDLKLEFSRSECGFAELSDVSFGFFRQVPRCCTHMPQQIPFKGIYLFIYLYCI